MADGNKEGQEYRIAEYSVGNDLKTINAVLIPNFTNYREYLENQNNRLPVIFEEAQNINDNTVLRGEVINGLFKVYERRLCH